MPQIPEQVAQLELYAWVGEDELGSGVVGLKQGLVPAGYIPLVAIARDRHKIERLASAMEMQAQAFGKKIRLCRFRFVEVVAETISGSDPVRPAHA